MKIETDFEINRVDTGNDFEAVESDVVEIFWQERHESLENITGDEFADVEGE